MKFTFTLPDSLPQMTVKQLLEEQLLIPRKIRHFLRIKKHILINQREVHWNETVNPGDVCQLTFDEEDYPEKEIPWGNPDLVQEVYQDQHLIIVNKPEGMKTEISREYWAQVDGHINSKELVFKDKIGRDRHDRRKRIVDTKNGQYAETHVSRLKQLPNKTSLVRCKLKTGRTHQIRVHLSHHNFPILGDPLYNSKSKTSRLMLHAFRLSFTHPLTLEKLSFTTLSDTFEKELKKNG